jgi:hypothetical protein|tara:strand:- start:193 stop:411 length:219 start_codon:yes stop_codon:yes gene_type:complete
MYIYKEIELVTKNSSWWKQKKYRKESAFILNKYRKLGWRLTKKIELKNKPNVDTRSFTLYSLKKLEGKKVGK